MSQVNFIKFFISNARVLESLKFIVRRDNCDTKWTASQHRKLPLNSRSAARGVRFHFVANYGSSGT